MSHRPIRTVPFRSVLHWVAGKIIGDPDRMSPADAAAYTRHINFHARECWERAFWPEWTSSEERWFRPQWSVGATYQEGDEVFHANTGAYWRCTIGPIFAEVPGDSGFWEQCGVDGAAALDPYIDPDEAGQTPVGTIDTISSANPSLYPGGTRYAPTFGHMGIQLPTQTANSVWVRFRLRPPEFTSTEWRSDFPYEVAARVYDVASGECYVAVDNSENATPASNPAKWEKIEFPAALAPAVQLFAYAEALEDDGQHDKARGKREDAEEKLADEWAKHEAQQGAVRRVQVLTRVAA